MRPFVYLDTCVLIGFSHGKHTLLLDKIKNELRAVYSVATITDLQVSGDDNQHLKLLDEIGAWRIDLNEGAGSQCCVPPNSAVKTEKDLRGSGSETIQTAENSCYQMFADFRRPSLLTLKGLLEAIRNAFMPLLKKADAYLHSHGIESSFAEQMASVDLSKTSTDTTEQFQKEIKQVTRGGSDAISQFQPPEIINQILDRMSGEDKEGFRATLALDPITIAGLAERAEYISTLGYGRDNRLLKPNNTIALKGARSEIHDHQHIAFGLMCGGIATSDKGVAIKAFALAEYYGLQSRVIYVPTNGSDPYILTKKCWI